MYLYICACVCVSFLLSYERESKCDVCLFPFFFLLQYFSFILRVFISLFIIIIIIVIIMKFWEVVRPACATKRHLQRAPRRLLWCRNGRVPWSRIGWRSRAARASSTCFVGCAALSWSCEWCVMYANLNVYVTFSSSSLPILLLPVVRERRAASSAVLSAAFPRCTAISCSSKLLIEAALLNAVPLDRVAAVLPLLRCTAAYILPYFYYHHHTRTGHYHAGGRHEGCDGHAWCAVRCAGQRVGAC